MAYAKLRQYRRHPPELYTNSSAVQELLGSHSRVSHKNALLLFDLALQVSPALSLSLVPLPDSGQLALQQLLPLGVLYARLVEIDGPARLYLLQLDLVRDLVLLPHLFLPLAPQLL